MKTFQDLDYQDQAQLLKFPAYVSLLAAASENGLDEKEKKAVLKLTHIRTFTSDPLLSDFYREAEQSFEKTIAALNNELPHEKDARRTTIIRELGKLEPILNKLGTHYGQVFQRSMDAYKQHVSKSHHNVFEFLIFPMPVKGMSNW